MWIKDNIQGKIKDTVFNCLALIHRRIWFLVSPIWTTGGGDGMKCQSRSVPIAQCITYTDKVMSLWSLIKMYKRTAFEYLFLSFIRMMKETKEIHDLGRLSSFKYKSNKNMIITFIQSLKYKQIVYISHTRKYFLILNKSKTQYNFYKILLLN